MTQTAEPPTGRQVPPEPQMDPEGVLDILARRRDDQGGLIAILQDIQGRFGHLPAEALRTVARQTGRSLVDVYGIATFYRSFALQPRGKHFICTCLGTACHVRGSPRILEEFQAQMGVRAGQTTADGQFTLETVNCLGACALGPVVVIDGHYFSKVRRLMVRQLLEAAEAGLDRPDAGSDRLAFPVEASCPRCGHSLMDDQAPLDSLASIRLSASCDGRHGWLWVSGLYGSPSRRSQPELPPGAVARLHCPHCHGQLVAPSDCPACEAPLAAMTVRGGGVLQVCPRQGCPHRALDLY